MLHRDSASGGQGSCLLLEQLPLLRLQCTSRRYRNNNSCRKTYIPCRDFQLRQDWRLFLGAPRHSVALSALKKWQGRAEQGRAGQGKTH